MQITESLCNEKITTHIIMGSNESPKYIASCETAIDIVIENKGNPMYRDLIRMISKAYSKYAGATIELGKDHSIIHIPEEAAKAYVEERRKRTMIDKAKNECGIVSYTARSVEDIDNINDACEIRIMVDQNDQKARKEIVDVIHKKWPDNLPINEIPMPGGVYIMIPESLAKRVTDQKKVIKAFDKEDYDKWHAELREKAHVITTSIFSSMYWEYDELMSALEFIINSKSEKEIDMKPEDCLETFELHGLQSINLIYWGLRLNADIHEEYGDKRNKLHDAIYAACDILCHWAKEPFKSITVTMLEMIHMLADDKKDKNGDFSFTDYEYFGVYGMHIMYYLNEPKHEDFNDSYNELIDKYHIIVDEPYSPDAWDIIYKNYIDIYKAHHNEDGPDSNPLFTFANQFREWIIFSEIFESLGLDSRDTEGRYKYYQLCMNQELYNAIYLNINTMQISDFLTKYEYQVYCAAKSDTASMQIEPMLILLLRFYQSIYGWRSYMGSLEEYRAEVNNFNETLDFLIENSKSKYLGYLAKRYL